MSAINATGFSLVISVPFAIAIRKSASGVGPSFKSGQGRLLTVLSWSMPSLPLPLRLANADPPAKVVHDRTQVLDQRLLFRMDHRHELLVAGAAAAWRARW